MIKRIVFGGVALLIVVIGVVLLNSDRIIKNYVVKHSKELIGRQIYMDKLNIGLNGSVSLINFRILEADSDDSFISFNEFKTKINPLALLDNKVIINEILFDELNVRVIQNGARFNFSDIIDRFSTTDTVASPAQEKSVWQIELNNIGLNKSAILYRDVAINGVWDLNNITLNIPAIYFSNQSTDVSVNLSFKDGGRLATKVSYDIEKGNYALWCALNNFNLALIEPYVKQQLKINDIVGKVNLDINVKGDIEHIMDFDANGNIGLSKFAITDLQTQQLALCDSVFVDVNRFSLHDRVINIGKLHINGMASGFTLNADGTTNFDDLLMETGQDTTVLTDAAPDTKPYYLTIGNLSFVNGRFTFADKVPAKPFTYTISDIKLLADNVQPNAVNSVALSARLQKSGSLNCKWTGNINDIGNQNIGITLTNLALHDFTPYAEQMFGFPVQKGNLSFISQNIIKNNKLKGLNRLSLYNPEVGKKNTTAKPEYNVPLKLALYVLTDRENKVNLELPVQGDIDSPEFSYKKLIIRTLINVLVKVAATPASFLTDAIGIKSDPFKPIRIDAMQTEFDASQYGKLEEFAQILAMKPELQLTLTQSLNYARAYTDIVQLHLKHDYYISQRPDSVQVNMLDKESIMNVNINNAGVVVFADSLLQARSLPLTGSITEKANRLYGEVAHQSLQDICAGRDRKLNDYLLNKLQVDTASIKVVTLPWDEMKEQKGNHQYVVRMDVKE
ncbi:MAG: DUF748 domain-containing protein [Marinifilaceae bacterium]